MIKHVFTIVIFLLQFAAYAQSPFHPFPAHTGYAGGLLPAAYTNDEMDVHVADFYSYWKSHFVRNDCQDTTLFYVWFSDTAISVSEGLGYGMMITAIMAGYDSDAKRIFDGMYKYVKMHPSSINGNLTDWIQHGCGDSDNNDDAATDGDIDIAFALLLADAQWGSAGEINYFEEALTRIQAIRESEVNNVTSTLLLGDWCSEDDSLYYYSVRSSDFILAELKVFAALDNAGVWGSIIDKVYEIINEVADSNTGLLPDFITSVNSHPEPAQPFFLEDTTDGFYYYNACRVPLRLGMDYLLTGDERAKNVCVKINDWLYNASNDNPSNISNGYLLDGTALYDWNDATFLGPFAVGAMCGDNQQWLNDLYEALLYEGCETQNDYYACTLKMLSLLVLSGNFWLPDYENIDETNTVRLTIYPMPARGECFVDGDVALPAIMEVYDGNGKKILSTKITSLPQRISVKKGFNLLKITGRNGKNFVGKIISE